MSLEKAPILDSINLSPLNTSKTKAMYSFGKSNRFSGHQLTKYLLPYPSSSFYDKPSMLNSRGTSFGFGNKEGLINKYILSNSGTITVPLPTSTIKIPISNSAPKKASPSASEETTAKMFPSSTAPSSPLPQTTASLTKKTHLDTPSAPKSNCPRCSPTSKPPGPDTVLIN